MIRDARTQYISAQLVNTSAAEQSKTSTSCSKLHSYIKKHDQTRCKPTLKSNIKTLITRKKLRYLMQSVNYIKPLLQFSIL